MSELYSFIPSESYFYSSNNKIFINDLDHEDSKSKQPKNISISLKPHQLTALHKMHEMESKKEIIINKENNKYILDTNIGILGDQVGYGKTITALSILDHQNIKKVNKKYLNNTSNTFLVYEINDIKFLNINIILVPHNIFFQWKKTITNYSNYDFYFVQKNSDLLDLKLLHSDSENIFKPNIKNILISSTRYKKFYESFFQDYEKKFEINRLIIDEADSINIPNMPRIKSSFTWFVTATFSKLTCCKNYGFLRYLFDGLDSKSFNMIVVKNKKEYIESSFNLIDYDTIIHNCFSLYYNLNNFKGLVSPHFIEMINAGDLSGAVEYLGFSSDTENDLIDLLTKDVNKKISNKLKKKKYINELDIPDNEKQQQLQVVNKEIEKLNNQLNGIKERIENINDKTCSICMDNFEEPVSLPCTHVFCTFCIINHIKFSNSDIKCPTCRTPFKPSNVIQIKDKINNKNESEKEKRKDKDEILLDLIESDQSKKFVIFSNFNNSFNKVLENLKKKNINFNQIKGSSVESIVNRFNDGNIRILFLNSKYCGAGIDLSSATDLIIYHKLEESLEKQVIGRAQRIGRKNKLTVHKLLYDGEEKYYFT
jgi:hypothetical protein